MLTPRFNLAQTESDIIFNVYAPFADISKTEIYVEDKTFIFYSPPAPYYLRLHLPGEIEESSSSNGSYDADSGTFTITVSKVNKGEYFPDLDMITSLLMTPSIRVNVSPGVQVIGDAANDSSSDDESNEIEWFAEPQSMDTVSDFAISGHKYGFASQKTGVFQNLQCVAAEFLDLREPDTTPAAQRNEMKIQQEHLDFNEDHYLADLMESEEIHHILQFIPPWAGDDCQWQQMNFSGAELDVLKELQNREYLLDKVAQQQVYLGVVDIIAAYCYNYRTTQGEDTSESAWTINKLSSTLSWMQCFGTVGEVSEAFVRRVLCYPLYRHWELALKVLEDVQRILCLGKKQLLKCFLDIHTLFNSSEPRYILNQLYIDDYCVWVQKASLPRLKSLAEALGKVSLDKSALDFDLLELESAASIVLEEERAGDIAAVADALNGLSLNGQHVAGSNEMSDDGNSSDRESSSSDSERETSSSSCSESSALDSDDISSPESSER